MGQGGRAGGTGDAAGAATGAEGFIDQGPFSYPYIVLHFDGLEEAGLFTFAAAPAAFRFHPGGHSFGLQGLPGEDGQGPGRRPFGLGDRLRGKFGTLGRAADEDPRPDEIQGPQLGMSLHEKAVLIQGETKGFGQGLDTDLGSHGRVQDQEVGGKADRGPQVLVEDGDLQRLLLDDHLGFFFRAEAEKSDPFFPGLLIIAFPQAEGAQVAVEDGDFGPGMEGFQFQPVFYCTGAADAAAVRVFRFPGTDALDS